MISQFPVLELTYTNGEGGEEIAEPSMYSTRKSTVTSSV